MTNDLISRDAVLEALRARGRELLKLGTSFESNIASCTALECVNIVKDFPTVDAAPVVHAKWVWADDGYCRCSNCTQKAPVMTQYQDEPTTTMTDYCPNCGALMK